MTDLERIVQAVKEAAGEMEGKAMGSTLETEKIALGTVAAGLWSVASRLQNQIMAKKAAGDE
jgi:hypothetical protein